MKSIRAIVIISLTFIAFGCREKTAPKPFAYPHIENSTIQYEPLKKNNFPITFNIADNANIVIDSLNSRWVNIIYPTYDATIYCSYISTDIKSVNKEKSKSRELVYVHSHRASEINALNYNDTIKGISAELYQLKGNTATPLQFMVSDDNSFIFRGSLYFNNKVTSDSVAPIIEYIKEDIIEIVESINKR
ncbi:MAG: hypothetical protein J6L02_01995 [Bacteroidales bacterium]|nr:hypothetical protein [Bacteroidales bacterium]